MSKPSEAFWVAKGCMPDGITLRDALTHWVKRQGDARRDAEGTIRTTTRNLDWAQGEIAKLRDREASDE